MKSGSYGTDLEAFVADIRQIWLNCQVYNDPESEIYEWAMNCKGFFEEIFEKITKKIKRKRSSTEIAKPNIPVEAVEPIPPEVDNVDDEVEAYDEHTDINPDEKKKRRIYSSHRVRMFRSILKTLYECEYSEPFKAPPTNPKYYDVVEQPIDLSVIKSRIGDYHNYPMSFLADVKLVFDNYLQVFSEDTEYHKSATKMKQLAIETFFKCFPSLCSLKADFIPSELPKKELLVPVDFSVVNSSKNLSKLTEVEVITTIKKSTSDPIVTSDCDPFKLFHDLPKSQKSETVNVKQIETTIRSLIDERDPNRIDVVRRYCQKKAANLVKDLRFPWKVIPELYEVTDLGSISTTSKNHTQNFLYPAGYSCLRTMRLCLVPETIQIGTTPDIVPFVPVNLCSKIVIDESKLLFRITLDNGVVICEGSDPRSVWQSLIGKEQQTLDCIGSKLHRCRAVFNRLCVSKDAEPFLEQVPMNDKIATDYYTVIKSPMWLREVHTRLLDGTYDNEFDFAWDIRLIFRNCKDYNLKGSTLYKAADRLSLLFDRLFIHWVYNVQDKSADYIAHGQWDDWYQLKYFDSADPQENVCTLTAEKLEESKLAQCVWCEDQYSWSALKLPRKPKSNWTCPRCERALEMSGANTLNDNPFGDCSKLDETFSSAHFGKNVFFPALDIGEGWYQAKKKNGSGLKNFYLSPLGYEVVKDEISAQKEFEMEVDSSLIAARTKEFQEQILTTKTPSSSNSKKKGRKPKVTDSRSDLSAPLHAKYLEEEGRIVNGKLYSFPVPSGYRIAWFVRSNDTISASDRNDSSFLKDYKELVIDEVPECGFFGLELQEIKCCLEGLDNTPDCSNYDFIHAEQYRSILLEEYSTKLQHSAASEEAVVHLKTALLNSRWYWEKEKLYPASNKTNPLPFPNIRTGFQPISTHGIPTGGMEILLSVWDFMESAQSSIGYVNVTLTELISSIFPPVSILPTCGQLVFDELGCIFTDLIFREIQVRYQCWSAVEWQDVLFVNPINTITWPKVAEKSILILSLPWTKSEAKIVLNSKLFGEPLIQLKILCLLYNHPIMDNFFRNERLLQLKSIILSSCKEDCIKISIPEFCVALCEIFTNVIDCSKEEKIKLCAEQLRIWLKSLFGRIGYMPVSQEEPLIASEMQPLLSSQSRDFGGYTMSCFGYFGDEILSPNSFCKSSELSFSSKMKGLLALERTLSLLSSVDTEGLCVQDRLSIYMTLIDHSFVTNKYLSMVQNRAKEYVSKFESLPEMEYSEIMMDNQLKSTTIPKDAKCYFTGISFSVLPNPTKWVAVPNEYLGFTSLDFSLQKNLENPETVDTQLDSLTERNMRSRFSTDTVYALKEVVNRIINCKKISDREKFVYENLVENRLKTLLTQDSDHKSSIFLRSKPIGYDDNGVSYWLLGAQSTMTLFSFDSAAKCKDPSNGRTHEPCFLARDSHGVWFYYPEQDVTQLFSTFSSSESLLRLRMIERYGMIRSAIKSTTLFIKAQQQLWYDRKISAESWVSEAVLYTGQNEAHRCRQLEVLWARCAEIRMNMYYAHFHCFEDDRERSSHRAEREAVLKRQRNMKENMVEDTFDCHPTKGWNRLDEFSRIRQLGATTTASRVHSDSTIATSIQANLKGCSYLKICKVDDVSNIVVPSEEVVSNSKELENDLQAEENENEMNHYSHGGSRTKPIEQLHLINNEVLRIYPSGKDAASFMNVSHSSISQCLQGKRSDCFGFRWRFYEGPSLDFEAIKDSQMSLTDLRALQLSRNKPIESADDDKFSKKSKISGNIEEQQTEKLLSTSNTATTQAAVTKNENFSFPSVIQPKSQHHIMTSTKTVPAKLVKLKGELLNMLFAFPEKALKWAELDPASETMIQATGEAAANNVYQSLCNKPDSNVDVDRLAEKASRKARRRLRRKLAVDIFLKSVQTATSPAELLVQVAVLEDAIPSMLTFIHNKASLPNNASTIAELALRLFVIDRSIAYHEIQSLENATYISPHKLRFHLSPRCHANGVCQRFLGHTGKCMTGPPSLSRLPDQFQLAPPQDSFSQQSSNTREFNHGPQPSTDRRPAPANLVKVAPKPVVDILPKLASYLEKEGIDIEVIQPYIPSFQEVSQAQWL